MNYTAAILLGLAGSFHCIGMCGPIALALPLGSGSKWQRITGLLMYNSGRILMYALMGIMAGAIGKALALAGLQQIVSIVVGVLMLVFVLAPEQSNRSVPFLRPVFKFTNFLRNSFRKLFNRRTRGALFFIGVLNGLLPCGLVYMAMAGALASSNVLEGGLFMALFGLGTVPVMSAVNLAKHLISMKARNLMRKAVPYVVSVMAIALVLRGLNLGIPYLSPAIDKKEQSMKCCHKASCEKLK